MHSSPISPSVWLRIGSAIFGRYRLKALYNTSHVGTFFFSFLLLSTILRFRYKERKKEKIRRRCVGITIECNEYSGISPNFEFTKRSTAKANEEKIEKREREREKHGRGGKKCIQAFPSCVQRAARQRGRWLVGFDLWTGTKDRMVDARTYVHTHTYTSIYYVRKVHIHAWHHGVRSYSQEGSVPDGC